MNFTDLSKRTLQEVNRFKINHAIYWKRADINSKVAIISAYLPDYFFMDNREEAFRIIKETIQGV
jgi:hypothetical protein